ncbi:MAG TPA: glycoside hydrolase family 3 protein [Longimicrobiales bacterium]
MPVSVNPQAVVQLEPPPVPRPVGVSVSVDTRWVDSTLATLSLRQKVGQMIMPWVLGDYTAVNTADFVALRDLIQTQEVGGFVMSIGAPLEVAQKLNMMQGMARVPLLIGGDVEHGAAMRLTAGTELGMQLGRATEFPPQMAIGAADDEKIAYELGRVTALESRAAGIHVAFAPDVDVNINPANPIINTRSFGADPRLVARMGAADLKGMQDAGLQATVKHFPGHGDVSVDSHLGLPILTITRARADSVELVPFRAAIQAGVSSVMSAHIAFPAITGDTIPATLTPRMLTGLLRQDLGFKGLIYTDALDMGGIVNKYGPAQASVMAIQAGADVLLMPPDVPAALNAVLAAVQSGQITPARIDQSVRKILEAKAQAGLDRNRFVDLNQIPHVIGIPAHLAAAEQAAQKGLTVGKDDAHLLPVLPGKRVLSVVYSDDDNRADGRTFQGELRRRLRTVTTAYVDTRTPQAALDSLLAGVDGYDVVFFSPFVQWGARKGSIYMDEKVAQLVQKIAARKPEIVTSFGNPYVLAQFPQITTYVLAWGPEDGMQEAAVKGLTGQAAITGRLPIPIPPSLPLFGGVRVDARSAAGGAR